MVESTIIIDTSFAYSLFDKHDTNHQKAKDALLMINDEVRIIIPFIVIAELLVGVSNKSRLLHFCKLLCNDQDWELNTINDLEIFDKLDFPTRKTLKANDCLIIALCIRYKANLLTFDKRLEKIYKRLAI